VAEQSATVARESASSKKDGSQKKGGPKGRKATNGGRAKAAPKKPAKAGKKATQTARAKEVSTPRAESKGAKILELIGRPKGATLAEIIAYASYCTYLAGCERFSINHASFR
jgi:hypothetical protein